MNLKRQLLLVSLLTLVLPWAGCQFVRETESALRATQQQMLAGTARALAGTLAQYAEEFPADDPDRVGEQLFGHRLDRRPSIDGYFDDWTLDRESLREMRGSDGPVRFAVGVHEQALYLYVEVSDREVVYATPATVALDDGPRFADRVVLASINPPYREEAFAFAAEAPGPLVAYLQTTFGFAPEPTVTAFWQDVAGGYQLEARIPLNRVGTHLGLIVSNTGAARQPGVRSASYLAGTPGRFVTPLPELDELAQRYVQPGMRLIVTDRLGWRLATAGGLDAGVGLPGDPVSNWLRLAYDSLVEPGTEAALAEPHASGREQQRYITHALDGSLTPGWFRSAEDGRAIVAVAAPVLSGQDTIGAVVLQQGTEAILSLTNRGLASLLNVTLIATLLVAAGLLGYASWLSRRIRKLSLAAEAALDRRGGLSAPLPSTAAGDEIGDLSRSFSHVLQQLGDYNEYLRTLASKLSHELRTPLAIVTSSLENLEHEPLGDEAATYTSRAKDGADRLRRILAAMSEASRVEELIAHAEPEPFDLAALLESTVAAYRDVYGREAYGKRKFVLETATTTATTIATIKGDVRAEPRGSPTPRAIIKGSPELVIQMLDKLVDNAVDFSGEGDTISIGLSRSERGIELTVTNPGPPLPERMRTQLFDSMVSLRPGGNDRHLGLGLYVAKLIAEGHAGRISADNVEGGVCFTVTLPAAA